MSIKKNKNGNFELEGVEFNGQVSDDGFFTGRCITPGWNHVNVIGVVVNGELEKVEFIATATIVRTVKDDFTRDDMSKVHKDLCGDMMFGPGFEWK